MAERFPNLPESKVCPECGLRFKWPLKEGRGGKLRRESRREWFRRTFCSNACRLEWFKRTGGRDG